MLSKFFVKHPIFATVLALVMVLAGGITLFTLPIAQYPDITPPTVQVTAIYPGADAETIAETVGVPIEQQVNGVDGMIYMSSTSSSTGQYTLTVTFGWYRHRYGYRFGAKSCQHCAKLSSSVGY